MASFRNNVALRSCTGSRIEGRLDCIRSIDRSIAITHTKGEVMLAENDIDWAGEAWGGCQDATNGKDLTQGICLLCSVLSVEYCKGVSGVKPFKNRIKGKIYC